MPLAGWKTNGPESNAEVCARVRVEGESESADLARLAGHDRALDTVRATTLAHCRVPAS